MYSMPTPHKRTPWAQMETVFMRIICAIMCLRTSRLPSFARRPHTMHGSTNQDAAGVGMIPLIRMAKAKEKHSVSKHTYLITLHRERVQPLSRTTPNITTRVLAINQLRLVLYSIITALWKRQQCKNSVLRCW